MQFLSADVASAHRAKPKPVATSLFLSSFAETGCGTTQSVSQTTACNTRVPRGRYAGEYDLPWGQCYNASANYVSTDVVTYLGSSYVATASSTGVAPIGARRKRRGLVCTGTRQERSFGPAGAAGAAGPQAGHKASRGRSRALPGATGLTGPART